ncbi:hypothetical protein IQ07DRAFT_481270, partial [Pyrenochaeta sp. DS3sAY3a]
MDGLGGVASVIAVVQLCEKVIKYVNNVCDAHKDIKRLRDQVRNCHVALLLLQDAGEVPEAAESWSHTLSALQGPLNRLKIALENAAKLLNVPGTTKEKLKWPFKKDEVQKLIQVIEAEKSLLKLALDTDSAGLIHKIHANSQQNNALLEDLLQNFRDHVQDHEAIADEIKQGLSAMSMSQGTLATGITELREDQMNQEERRERESILLWISQIDHAAQQHDVLSKRKTGTGEWLLAAEEYLSWLNGDQQTLFCPGIPGAGKTVLSSIVNEDLWIRHHENRTVGLSFLFCNYKRREEQTIEGLLASLVRQLAERQLRLPDSLRVLYTNHGRGQRRPSVTNICEVLQSIIEGLSKVFMVIDGIDECRSDDGCRARLITQILKLRAIRNVHLFLTTRHIPEITENFRDAPLLEVRANDEDVGMYLDENMPRLPKFVQNHKELQEEIKEKIVKAVDGMFLLAKLYLNSLIGSRSPKAIRVALDELVKAPRSYDSAYKTTMERIETQIPARAELAIQALAWITFARTPLTQIGLRDALGVESGEPHFDPDNCPDIEDVLSACAGLLTIDHESDVARLVHFTLQEYFERTQSEWFPGAQETITSACATHLSSDYYKPDDLEAHWKKYCLLRYASNHWMDHARLAESCNAHVMKFLREPAKVKTAVLAMENFMFGTKYVPSRDLGAMFPTGLHLAAYVGLVAETMKLLSGEDLDELHNRNFTPLMLASHEGHVEIVETLLHHRASLIPLTSAEMSARQRREAIVRILVKHGANLTLGHDHKLPMVEAARLGLKSVIEIFLDEGVCIDMR